MRSGEIVQADTEVLGDPPGRVRANYPGLASHEPLDVRVRPVPRSDGELTPGHALHVHHRCELVAVDRDDRRRSSRAALGAIGCAEDHLGEGAGLSRGEPRDADGPGRGLLFADVESVPGGDLDARVTVEVDRPGRRRCSTLRGRTTCGG